MSPLPAVSNLTSDLKLIAKIGLPLAANNIASIGVTVADTLMASSLDASTLAAVALGSGIWICVFLLGLGVIMAIGPTVAQHFGAGRLSEIGHDTHQGMWLALIIATLVIVAMRSVETLLIYLGIEAAVSILTQGYLDALSWGVPGAYAYHALKQMNEGVGRTIPIMMVMGLMLPVNIFLNYTFMFGKFGFAPIGAVGCGLGNGITFWMMYLLLAGYSLRTPRYRQFALNSAFSWPERAAMSRLVRLGWPIGLSLFLQSGLFTTVALLMGTIGTQAVAAHQIALNYSGLVFMLPLGLGMALTVVVGQAVGRGDPVGARRIGFTGFALCGAIAAVSALTTLIFAAQITAVYTDDPALSALTITLFRIAALLQLGDGLQVAAAFALRGMKDTRIPMILNGLNYWGIGFVMSYGLGIVLGWGASGIWLGLATALCTASVLLIGRFHQVTRRSIGQLRATAAV